MSTESTGRYFVVLMESRSGSTHFVDLVRQHPQVIGRMETLQRGETHEAQVEAVRDYFESRRESHPDAAIGFKDRIWHFHEPDALLGTMQEYDPVFFVMRRPNLVRRIVSVLRGRQLREVSGKVNLWTGMERPPPAAIDIEDFAGRLRSLGYREQEMEDALDRVGIEPFEVDYQHLRYHPNEVTAEFFEAVGVEPMPGLESGVGKLTPDDLREVVLNFDELIARYEGTPYYDMFFEAG